MSSVAVFFFFFSSRRRHTRLQGDWSSDVCSSDLVIAVIAIGVSCRFCSRNWAVTRISVPPVSSGFAGSSPAAGRSEERRVGKECSCGGGAGEGRKREGDVMLRGEQCSFRL